MGGSHISAEAKNGVGDGVRVVDPLPSTPGQRPKAPSAIKVVVHDLMADIVAVLRRRGMSLQKLLQATREELALVVLDVVDRVRTLAAQLPPGVLLLVSAMP